MKCISLNINDSVEAYAISTMAQHQILKLALANCTIITTYEIHMRKCHIVVGIWYFLLYVYLSLIHI